MRTNWPKWVSENPNKLPKDKVELLKKAVSIFIDKNMESESDAVDFYNKISSNSSSIITDFNKFIVKSDFSTVDLKDKETPESLFDKLLLNITLKKCIKIETSRKKIKDIYTKEYEIKDYSVLEDEIKWYTTSKLSNLLSSEIARFKLLKNIYKSKWLSIPKETDFYNKIESQFNIKWVKLSLDQEKSLKRIMSLKTNVTISDLSKLINANPSIFTTLEQKQLFIKTFLPTVSLWQLLDWWIIDKKQMNLAIDAEYESILAKYWVEKDDIWENLLIDPYDIIISTFTFPEDTVDKLLGSSWIKNIVNEINELKEHVKSQNSIVDFLDEDNTFDSFLDYVKDYWNINSKNIIQSLSKIKKWNYIKISYKWEKGKDTSQFFYINNVDIGNTVNTKWLDLKNVGTSCWILDHTKVNSDPILVYQSFFELIKNIDNSKDSLIEIYDNHKKLNKEFDKDTWVIINEWKTEFESLWLNIQKEYSEISNVNELKNALDCIDKEWTKVDIKKMAFIASANKKNKQEEACFTVSYINDDKIILSNWESFSLYEFANVFKERKCTRFVRNDSFEELFKNVSLLWDWFKDFNWLVINSAWKIAPEEHKSNSDFSWIEYFVWDDWFAINLLKTSDWWIEFHTWKYKETKKWLPDTFEWKYIYRNLDEFYYFTKKYNLKPKIDIEVVDEKIEAFPRNKNFMKSWLGMLSIAEIIAWGKQFIDSIEQNLAQWNKLKSAQFALKLWKMLPWYDTSDLQSFLEWEEKKTMEEMTDWLKRLDSKVMMPKVKWILLNWSSHQYEIEAALMATLKYGTLYPKWELKEYRWKYLWYQALGWDLRDLPRYKQSILENDPDVVINEELILTELLSEQAKWKWKFKRRSKIHKEYAATLWAWIDKEMWDWEKDTWDKMTQKWRIENVIWELKNWTYANWIGWIEKIWWKWPTPAHAMNTVPFVIAVTWIAKNFPQQLINKVMWLGFTSPYTALTFNNKASNIDLYNKTVEKVVESFEWTNWWSMTNAFNKINKAWEWQKVQAAYDFWLEYWSKIDSRLNLSDWYIYSHRKENTYFSQYVEWLTGVHSDADFSLKSEDITSWVIDYKTTPLFYTWWKKLFRSNFKFDVSWNLSKEWGILLKEVLTQMRDIKNLKLSDDPDKNKELQKQLYKDLYSSIEPAIRKWLWTFSDEKQSWKSPEIKMLKREWIDINAFSPTDDDFVWSWKHDPMYWYIESPSYDKFLEQRWNSYIWWDFEEVTVEWNEEDTKETVCDILTRFKSNENKK